MEDWKDTLATMASVKYNSYVLRCWARTEGANATSFAVEHVQTGAQHRVEDIRSLIAWIEEHNRTSTPAPDNAAELDAVPREQGE